MTSYRCRLCGAPADAMKVCKRHRPPGSGLRLTARASTGLVFVTSLDVPGLLVAEPTLAEALAAVPAALEDLRAARTN